jgi:nicotinamidase-related amidase
VSEWKMDGKPALVLFHMQKGLAGEQDFIPNWGGDAAVAIRESGMIDRILDLLAAFRAKKLPVAFVNAIPNPIGVLPAYGHIYNEIKAANLRSDLLHDERMRNGLDVMPEMNRRPDEPILMNWLLGAFTMSGLDIWLKTQGVKTCVFGGFAGHSVVYTSTVQAGDDWYSVIIPRDATCVLVPRVTVPEGTDIAAIDKKVEEVVFDILAPAYSLVTTTEDVIKHL